jgi:hypothetical protein
VEDVVDDGRRDEGDDSEELVDEVNVVVDDETRMVEKSVVGDSVVEVVNKDSVEDETGGGVVAVELTNVSNDNHKIRNALLRRRGGRCVRILCRDCRCWWCLRTLQSLGARRGVLWSTLSIEPLSSEI